MADERGWSDRSGRRAETPGETLYVSGGTPSGSKYYEIQDEAPEWIAYSIPEQQATVSLITISKNQLILETYSQATQELIDRCEIRK